MEIYKLIDGQLIKGTTLKIFLVDSDAYYLVDLQIYANGYLDCFGKIDIETLDRNFRIGKITLEVPHNQKTFIPYIGPVVINKFFNVEQEKRDPIELINSIILNLNKEETESDRCIMLFKEYLIDPSIDNCEKLKESYLKLPNERNLFEGIENKDPVVLLFEKGTKYTKEERVRLLQNYFWGEWIEVK